MMKKFLLRWLVNFLGLLTAASLVSGIQYGERIKVLVVASLIFSLVNLIIRPIAMILALPAIVMTLGLFTLVVNTSMLYIVTFFYPKFSINSLWAAIFAVIIVWIANFLLTDLLEEKNA